MSRMKERGSCPECQVVSAEYAWHGVCPECTDGRVAHANGLHDTVCRELGCEASERVREGRNP